MYALPTNPPSYLELSDETGFMHIAFYSTLEEKSPVWLTQGQFEVDSIIKAIKKVGNLDIYYISTESDSRLNDHTHIPGTEKHIWR